MPYGIKHSIEFASGQILNGTPNIYQIDILEKDYEGDVTKLTGTSKPFVLSYQSGDDRIIVPISASEGTVSFWNLGLTPLLNFYSEDDEQFRIDYYYRSIFGNQLLWRGFVLQDSCQEEFHDPPYEVTLKATDNLALLKTIPFDLGIAKVSLFAIIRNALEKTGIELPFHILSNIYENSTNDRDDDSVATMFEQTLIFTGKYQNDDETWRDYYSIIEEIFTGLNATLLQAQGRWYLIRFPEYKYFDSNHITGTYWQSDFTLPQFATYQPNFLFSFGTENEFITADQTRRISRPFKSVKNTFNYQQPKELIRNINLQEKGNLLREYPENPSDPDNHNIVREYELPYWFLTNLPGQPDVFLRVIVTPVVDSVDEVEKERYIVVSGGTFGGPYLTSSSFYIDTNDRVSVSFQLRTSDSQVGASNNTFLFQTDNGINIYKINYHNGLTVDGSWATNGGAIFSYGTQQDISEWTSFSVDSLGVPIEGYFSIQLNQLDNSGTIHETHYKDIRVEYQPYINRTSRIIGQYHLQEQDNQIKNVYDEEIFIDDSPKHSIAGALFTPALTNGDYITLTANWHRLSNPESLRLGQIITLERKEMASRARTVIEGAFIYNQPALSIVNVMQIGSLAGLNFIWGVVSFDFYAGTATGVLKELYTNAETQPDYDYTFSYIFQTN